jgi:hypothetical protein
MRNGKALALDRPYCSSLFPHIPAQTACGELVEPWRDLCETAPF